MDSEYIISPWIYYLVYLWAITVLCLAAAWVCGTKTNARLLKGSPNSVTNVWLITSVFVLFLGLRPISSAFGDMVMYRRGFYDKYSYGFVDNLSKTSEPLWTWLQDFAHYMMPGASLYVQYSFFCFLVCLVYIAFMAWACVRLNRRSSYLLLIFLIANFGFYAYCVNGMRNGMACSMVLLAVTYMTRRPGDLLKAGFLAVCAYLIHNSSLIPIVAMVLACYVLRDTRKCIYVWLGSIVVSLAAGSLAENFFMGLGFGDRMSSYLTNHDAVIASEFGAQAIGTFNIGFRWDFLLYSAAPIALGWYVVCKRRITDGKYTMLLNTYILANCVWVMLIRAFFSNRFAYLSWFMYGVVLAYPLFKFNIYRRQGMVVAAFIVGTLIFTWINI